METFGYFDRKGNQITSERYMELFATPGYTIVAKDKVGDAEVSTVWLGIAFPGGDSLVRLFETVVFFPDLSLRSYAVYGTEEDALRGHEECVIRENNALN